MSDTTPDQRRAVIDIGTNSVKLLVADVAENHVEPVSEDGRQTRLGEGFYEAQWLQPAAIARTLEAVVDDHARAVEMGAGTIRIVATSAVRDARNGDELRAAIRERVGLTVEVLSGEQEAEWAFRGVMTDTGLSAGTVLILDVGGGSAEFIVGRQGELRWRDSFPLGTVRWLERIKPQDPPLPGDLQACRQSIAEFLRAEAAPRLEPELESARAAGATLVGVGGAVNTLTRMELGMDHFDRGKIEAARLNLAVVTGWVERLWSLSFSARGDIAGLPPERADVMLMGVCILEGVLEQFRFSELRPSGRGLRFAAVMG